MLEAGERPAFEMERIEPGEDDGDPEYAKLVSAALRDVALRG